MPNTRLQKPLEVVPITPPPHAHRRGRQPVETPPGEKRTRYSLPTQLTSSSPVGFRTRVSLTTAQAAEGLQLLSLERPTGLADGSSPPDEQELFEELSLGVLSARQSTNFRGHRVTLMEASDAARVADLVGSLQGLEGPSAAAPAYAQLVLCRPYRTPFTMLLTLLGHKPFWSLPQTLLRAARKRLLFADDIPTIGFLTDLHIGIVADAMERAAVIASAGKRRAMVFSAPFVGRNAGRNRTIIRQLEQLAGLTLADRALGWRLGLVALEGDALEGERVALSPEAARAIGANLMAFRSERIQPGVNHEPTAPSEYHQRQPMDVSEELTVQAGRAAYNAFDHWTGCNREQGKELLLLDRIDVLTPDGKERLRALRQELADVTEQIIDAIPAWADIPTAKAFTRNAARGKKAFALAGQRIYIVGLDREAIADAGIDWSVAVRAVGAAAARSALYAEFMGVTELPTGCDLLAGVCLMAGPVNQNDIGKQFFGFDDLLTTRYPAATDPTSLLVWTLKAKTVTDPIGNEEQLLNQERKGALVDLRPGPHDVVKIHRHGRLVCFRKDGDRVSQERAFGDVGNFVTDAAGEPIPGNPGEPWGG